MEEITIRFEIVRLAVKMADHDTVAIQSKKLRDISIDQGLNEIIDLLESRNYRQALFLMKEYISSLDDSFFNTKPAPSIEEKKPELEPQNLFDMMQPQPTKKINLDDMLKMTQESAEDSIIYNEPKVTTEEYVEQTKNEIEKSQTEPLPRTTIDDQLQTDTDKTPIAPIEPNGAKEYDILDNDHDGKLTKDDLSGNQPDNRVTAEISREGASKSQDHNVFSKTEPSPEIDNTQKLPEVKEIEVAPDELDLSPKAKEIFESPKVDKTDNAAQKDANIEYKERLTDTPNENTRQQQKNDMPKEKEYDAKETDTLEIKRKEDYSKENKKYPPISYIDQKFRNMKHQFPQVEQSELGMIEEVRSLLKQIATNGYTENDILDIISLFKKKKAQGELAEAAQILLLAAASESKYAQLLLARELFKGEVLKVDYPEAFTQINRLAEHDYPEAICDLAQLYEYGYGIKKDKKTALLLYEEAAEMGVERARKHVDRLSRKKGILSSFFK